MLPVAFDIHYRNRLKQKRFPLSVMFELTHRCNLNCLHCYIRVEGEEYKKRELGFSQICDILEQVAEAGVIYLGLTGGEPLLRPDFKDIYLFAKKKGFAVSVLTNATLITKNMVYLFKEYPPAMLEISNYGLTVQTYEDVTRVKGSFERFQKAIEMLKKTNIRFKLRFVIMKKNYKQATKKEIIKKLGKGCSYGYGIPFFLRKDGNKIKNSLIKKQRFNPDEMVNLLNNLGVDFLNNPRVLDCNYNYADACTAGTLACAITPYGKLIMCEYIDEPNADLRKVKFIDAWKSYKINKTPRMKQDIACGNCKFRAYCLWCPGIAYMETGSSEKKIPYLCQVMKALKQDEGKRKKRIYSSDIDVKVKNSTNTKIGGNIYYG